MTYAGADVDDVATDVGLPTEAGESEVTEPATAGLPTEAAETSFPDAAGTGLPTEAAEEVFTEAAKVGHTAPAFTHSVSASISSSFRRPPFGIFSLSV